MVNGGFSIFMNSSEMHNLDKSVEHVFRSIRAKMAELQPSKDFNY